MRKIDDLLQEIPEKIQLVSDDSSPEKLSSYAIELFNNVIESYAEAVREEEREPSAEERAGIMHRVVDMVKIFVKHGVDMTAKVGDTSFFENIDEDVVLGHFCEMPNCIYECLFYSWLYLLGEGVRLSDGQLPLKILGNRDTAIFQDYESYGYRYVPIMGDDIDKDGWKLEIYEKDTDIVVAVL